MPKKATKKPERAPRRPAAAPQPAPAATAPWEELKAELDAKAWAERAKNRGKHPKTGSVPAAPAAPKAKPAGPKTGTAP